MADSTPSDPVVPEMRHRLAANKSGKMTAGQWLDIVLQPLTPLLLLILPAGFILLPRLMLMVARGGWMLLLGIVLFLSWGFIVRARRYARAPLHFAEMRAEHGSPPVWMFWRPLVLVDKDGKWYNFGKRLAPRPILQRGQQCIVYYLNDVDGYVLLSIAPADHPDVEKWRPDRNFFARFEHRSRNA